MMKKNIGIILAAGLILTACVTGCGNPFSNNSAEYKNSATAEAPYEAAVPEMAEETMDYEADSAAIAGGSAAAVSKQGTVSPAYNTDVKLIFRASLSAETTDLDATARQIEELTESMGGYLESSNVDTSSDRTGTWRYAYYTVRVPSDKYDAFLDVINKSEGCTVTNISKSTEDVGLQYADTEAHLETLKIKQKRYQELLEEATEMDDIISLESALSDVEYEIEWYSSDLNRYDSLINYSTISINVTEVKKETQIPVSDDFGERMQTAFSSGLDSFVNGLQGFAVFLAYAMIPLIIIVVIIIAVLLFLKKRRAKARAKNNIPPSGKQEMNQ